VSEPVRILAEACWPDDGAAAALPRIPGFVLSAFSPLAAELAERCLERYFRRCPADPRREERTGVLIASRSGDTATAAAIAAAVDVGVRVPPLLFYQSNPNAVAGYLTARWGLGGPVVCISPERDVREDALDRATAMVADGDADAVLVIVAETGGGRAHGVSLLLGPKAWEAQ
jgi:3-oxoacyl-(acyl-carrier-protein) synthase